MDTNNKLGRILMVEDDPKDVELTLTALEEYNLANEVVVTRDGEQAARQSLQLSAGCLPETKQRSASLPREFPQLRACSLRVRGQPHPCQRSVAS